jgi:hypothetical protein
MSATTPSHWIDRRSFLKAGSGVLLGLAVPSFADARDAGSDASPADWADLARALNGHLLERGVPNFASIAAPWNLRFASTVPQAIARCATPDDVRTCLLWAAANKMPFAIRSGGHSYAGFSTTTGLLLDVSALNAVRYGAPSGRVHLGGGFRPLPAEASATILDHLRSWPGTSESADWKMFLAGGAVASVAPEATAFVHRKASMLTSIDLDWSEGDSAELVAANQAWR